MLSNTPAHQPWYWHQCSIIVETWVPFAIASQFWVAETNQQQGQCYANIKSPITWSWWLLQEIGGGNRQCGSLDLELDKCGLFSSSSFITQIKTCPQDGRQACRESELVTWAEADNQSPVIMRVWPVSGKYVPVTGPPYLWPYLTGI